MHRSSLIPRLGRTLTTAPASKRASGARGPGRRAWLAVLALAAALVVASSATAAGGLDQSQTTYSGRSFAVDGAHQLTQTFTAGITGSLDQVDLYLTDGEFKGDDLKVRIETTVAGLPSRVVLASATVPAASVPGEGGWVAVPLTPSAPSSAGTQYAIVLSSSSSIYDWEVGSSNPYAAGTPHLSLDGGATWQGSSSDDFMFRTFVTPDPTPPVDTTAPVLSCAGAPQFLLNQAGASVGATVSDAGSGPARGEVSAAADTSSVGAKTVTLSGADQAGNQATIDCPYTVGYGFSGFFAPVDGLDANGNPVLNLVKAGKVIPLKWRLTDATGAPVSTLTYAQITVAGISCAQDPTVDAIEETATVGSGLQNLGDGNYQLNWKSASSYAASCKQLRLDLGERNNLTDLIGLNVGGGVVYHTADFNFTK